MRKIANIIYGDIFKLLLLVFLIKVFLFWWGYNNFNFIANPHENWLTIWSRWDSRAYIMLAEEWYVAPSADSGYRNFLSHFPPLYPAFIFLLSSTSELSYFYSAMLISFLSIMVASYLLYRLVLFEFNDKNSAFYSVLLMNVFPISYFSITPYAESLYLAFIIGSFYLLRRSSYALTGLTGLCAVLIRLSGVAMYPVYFAHFLKKVSYRDILFFRTFGNFYLHRKIIFFTLFTPLCGILAYLAINLAYYGDPLFFIAEYNSNSFSAKRLIYPGEEIFESLNRFLINSFTPIWDDQFMMTLGWGSIFTAIALFAVILGIYQKIPLEYTVYSLSSILFYSSFSWGISNARYAFAIFPMFIVFSRIKNKAAVKIITAAFFIFLMYFTKIYIGGSWAF